MKIIDYWRHPNYGNCRVPYEALLDCGHIVSVSTKQKKGELPKLPENISCWKCKEKNKII